MYLLGVSVLENTVICTFITRVVAVKLCLNVSDVCCRMFSNPVGENVMNVC